MDKDLNLLEDKLNQLVKFVDTIKQENDELKPNLHKAQEEIKLLKSKIQEATAKIENLLGQLPK
jgi:peptidoglycan hydrolase CwlO-like protein